MTAVDRSNLPEVRNPLLKAEAARRFAELPPEASGALLALAVELRDLYRADAEAAWKRKKAPLALYNRWAATYLTHLIRLLRRVKKVQATA